MIEKIRQYLTDTPAGASPEQLADELRVQVGNQAQMVQALRELKSSGEIVRQESRVDGVRVVTYVHSSHASAG